MSPTDTQWNAHNWLPSNHWSWTVSSCTGPWNGFQNTYCLIWGSCKAVQKENWLIRLSHGWVAGQCQRVISSKLSVAPFDTVWTLYTLRAGGQSIELLMFSTVSSQSCDFIQSNIYCFGRQNINVSCLKISSTNCPLGTSWRVTVIISLSISEKTSTFIVLRLS